MYIANIFIFYFIVSTFPVYFPLFFFFFVFSDTVKN